MFEKHTSSHMATAEDQALAEAVRRAQQPDLIGSPNLSADELAEAAMHPERMVEVNGTAMRYSVADEDRMAIQVGAADPVGHVINENIAQLDRRAQHLRDEIASLTDPKTGQPREGFSREHAVAIMQLQNLQRAAAYEQTVAAGRMRMRHEAAEAGRTAELRDELDAIEDRMEDATSQRFAALFGRTKIV